jgi:hypothetical protein
VSKPFLKGKVMSDEKKFGFTVAAAIGAVLLLVATILWAWPNYGVYSQRLSGEAKLAESESSRKVLIEEAKAKKESAKLLAEAEVERAKGVAEANKIIGDSLKGHEEYLRYLWITGLESGQNRETVYVPTEAGLPILEASRFMLQKESQKEAKKKD